MLTSCFSLSIYNMDNLSTDGTDMKQSTAFYILLSRTTRIRQLAIFNRRNGSRSPGLVVEKNVNMFTNIEAKLRLTETKTIRTQSVDFPIHLGPTNNGSPRIVPGKVHGCKRFPQVVSFVVPEDIWKAHNTCSGGVHGRSPYQIQSPSGLH